MRAGARTGVLLVVLALPACSSRGEAAQENSGRERVTISAAASLAAPFTEVGRQFEAAHPKIRLTFNFGPSSALAEQITRGAPVDVFAAADATTMHRVTAADAAAGPPKRFARNVLQIAVPADNRGRVRGLRDLARPELVIALCAEQVPCGRAAAKALADAGVTAQPDTLEPDAAALLTKVKLGEVDAALAYRTDVLAARRTVAGIDFPEAAGAANDYLIVAVKDSASPAAAQAFVDFVTSPVAQDVLARGGFTTQ